MSINNIRTNPMQKPFFPAIHAFRVFAILSIVFLHTIGFVSYFANNAPPSGALLIINNMSEVLFHGFTILFALISGCLFSLVLAQKGWRRFFTTKILYVLLPYVLFSALFTWVHWGFDGLGRQVFDQGIGDYFLTLFKNLYTGEALFTFWYLPVLLSLYLSTPLIYALICSKNYGSKIIVAILLLMPLLVSRSWPDNGIHNYIYFVGAYTLGLLTGQHYQKALTLVTQYWVMIAGVAIALSLALMWLQTNQVDKFGAVSLRESLHYLHKICFAALLFAVFERNIKSLPKWVDHLGKATFSIYFIHGFLLFEGVSALAQLGVKMPSVYIILLYTCLAVITQLIICMLIVYLARKLLGRYSKMIVGA